MKHLKYLLPVLIIAIFLYTFRLDKVPVHFNQDELGFSLNAYSIAKTGYDENNRFMPFYFWHLGLMWSTPIIVYLTAAILTIAPLSEFTVRLASVSVGILNITLLYFIAYKIFKKQHWAAITAALMLITPVHLIHSRLLLDNLYTVPFVLGWFLATLCFAESRKYWQLFLSALLLGIGLHSYHAAKIIMPLFLCASFVIFFPDFKKRIKMGPTLILGFILPIIPLIFWLQKYPDTLTDQVKYVGLYDTNLSPLQGLLTLINPQTIMQRFEIYVSYFAPDFLFFKGDSSLIHSTHTAGVFLLPCLLLIPYGIYLALRNKTWIYRIIVFGFFSAPVAASFVGNQYRISKSLTIIPFGVLLTVIAIKKLFESREKVQLYLAYFAVATLLAQFFLFFNDYQTDYRARSYSWFNFDIPGSLETTITAYQKQPAQTIYLDQNVWFIDRYWKFYAIKHNEADILLKTKYYDPAGANLLDYPANSIYHYRFDHLPANALKPIILNEPDGTASYYVYRQ